MTKGQYKRTRETKEKQSGAMRAFWKKAKEAMANDTMARSADRSVGGKSAANTVSKSQTKKGDRRNSPGLQML